MRSIKLDRPKLAKHDWFRHCYDADLAATEYDAPFPPAWLVKETRRIGAKQIQAWLCDDSVRFSDYDAGLAVAECSGVA